MKYLKKRQGFTMIEVLVSLVCISLLSVLFCQIASLIKPLNHPSYDAEDDIGLKQLRLILAQASEFEAAYDTLYFLYHGEQYRLELYQNQLVKRKGYEVLLQDIDDASFSQTGACITLTYQRFDQTRSEVIACE